jgi:phage N-6-adenine-methyltransferase
MTSKALEALTSTTGNKTDCWNTPPEFVGDVLKYFGTLDLDPCSNDEDNPNVPAKRVYTEITNGLAHRWTANSVFMNHPYSQSDKWIPYAVSQYELGYAKEMILLIKLDVSTKWWRSVSQYSWIAVNERMKFGDGTGASPFQSAIIYLGKNLDKFNTMFCKYGTLYAPYYVPLKNLSHGIETPLTKVL